MQVYIADDHPIFRSGLKLLLEHSFDNVTVHAYENGEDLLEAIRSGEPDVVIVDIDMPGRNGLEVCRIIQTEKPATRTVILTMYKDSEMLKLAFFNGAKGYLVKDNTSEELVDCINYVLTDKSYIAKSIREHQSVFEGNDLQIAELLNSLTRTEIKTLKLVAQKLSSKEIADLLFVSVKSVENYRSRICKKLNLDARNNSLLLWVLDNKSIIDGIK